MLAYLALARIGDAAELILLQAGEPVLPSYAPGLIGEAAVQFSSEADTETRRRLLDAEAYLQVAGTVLHRKGAGRAAWLGSCYTTPRYPCCSCPVRRPAPPRR